MCRQGSHKIRLHMLDSNAARHGGHFCAAIDLMSHRLGEKFEASQRPENGDLNFPNFSNFD